jgi:competence protein CoiA
MLVALGKPNNAPILAHLAQKPDGPFHCPDCGVPVVLKRSRVRTDHFAHTRSELCAYSAGESDDHRRCKFEIYQTLLKHPGVESVLLEQPLGSARPDVSAAINGVPVAIEIQISNLSMETIMRRTQEYATKGIYVLWLLQWTPYLDGPRYSPRLWEKWIHAAYFGRVYYWVKGLTVIPYHFEPHLKHVPARIWFTKTGQKVKVGGYGQRSKRYRSPVRRRPLNLVRDFGPRDRDWWQDSGFSVPSAKLFMEKSNSAGFDANKRVFRPYA